jgi:arylsulfatase A-like enzyme
MRNLRVRLAILAGVLGALCCGRGPDRINVMIIAVDTLRADHLGCYGYARDTSPHLDSFAAEGVLCERCESQAPWTLPSFSTVFTSLYPTQHGAETVYSALRKSVPTLAGILKEHGYATGGVVNAPALKPAYGVDRGFGRYEMTPPDGRTATGTTRDALALVDSMRDAPFFAFVHYFDPHLAYSPPAPYDKRFTTPYEGRIGYSFNLEGFSRVRGQMFAQMRDLSPGERDRIVGLYDGEIAFTDSAIADLLRGLDERNLRDNTLIVFLSDHGEEFFEHGGFEHGHSLYEELVHVPLLFRLPGRLAAGTRLQLPVRLLDVAPTILDFLGIEAPPNFEGMSIRKLLEGEGRLADSGGKLLPGGMAYAEALMHGREQKSITAYPWKLVYEMGTERELLFNLAEDPGETHSVLEDNQERAADLENILFGVLFGISDTWYVEMSAGSEPRVFDVDLAAKKGLSAGTISVFRLLDGKRNIVAPQDDLSIETSGICLSLRNLRLRGAITLAFKVSPLQMPVEFNIAVDGRPATANTFLGRDLRPAETMPFSIPARRRSVLSDHRPGPPSGLPYAVVWLEKSAYSGDTGFKLDEATKKELRSLGYIQ